MKRIIPIVILLAAAVAAGVYYYPRLIKKPAPANQLTLSGNIEAHESLVGFKVPGRIVELPVEEGQQVAQGALLARLDDADYKQKVRIDEASGARARIESCAHAGRNARAGNEGGAANDDRCRRPIWSRRNSTTTARSSSLRKDEVSAQERDLAATALKRAEAIFKAAQQRYNEAVEGSRKEDIAIARANLNRGQREPWAVAGESELHGSARAFGGRDDGAPGGAGRSGCAGFAGGDACRSRSHLAARLYSRDRSGHAFIGVRTRPSPPTPIPASNITGAFRSSRRTRSSRPRACRQSRSA